EARGVPRPEGGDEAHDSADEEQPAQEDRDREGGERRDHDRQKAQHDEDDSLHQEQDPVLVDRLRKRALQPAGVARIRRHVRSPRWWCAYAGKSNMNARRQYTGLAIRATYDAFCIATSCT